ncbi:hypothetical protein KAU11_05425 [Candidatus Babeliales bacterium]|nr:hypothetical protein [Candidatus Babeliales bacterium]
MLNHETRSQPGPIFFLIFRAARRASEAEKQQQLFFFLFGGEVEDFLTPLLLLYLKSI